MAMIRCPECGTEISSRATACVKCGISLKDITICSECGSVNIKISGGSCSKCGCPFEENTIEVTEKNTSSSVSKNDKTQSDEEYIEISEKIVRKVLQRISISSGGAILCESGFPISNLSKAEKVRYAFDIPNNANVFFAISANIFGGFNENAKGLAISSYGIHFRDDSKKTGMFYMDDFVNIKIGKKFSGFLTLASFEFNLGIDCMKVKRMLEDLQEEISLHV